MTTKRIYTTVVFLLYTFSLLAQNVTLSFTGQGVNNEFIPLHRVVIMDETQNWQETIYYPDTIYVTSSVGIGVHDGNLYRTVQIGQQCWMRKNMRTTHFSDGTDITLCNFYPHYWSDHFPYCFCYYPNKDSSTVSTYGFLYNWPAAMKTSLCCETKARLFLKESKLIFHHHFVTDFHRS